MKGILVKALAVLAFLFRKAKKVVPEVVKEVEQAARDGKVTKGERKHIAMKAIQLVAAEFGVEMNFIVRLIVSKLVDQAAKKLPQSAIAVPDVVAKVCDERVKSRT